MAGSMIGALRVFLGMDAAAFEKGADMAERRAARLSRRLTQISKKMKSIGTRMSVGITAPIMGLAWKSVAAMKQQEQAVAAVEAALGSMGERAGFTLEELQAKASALQETSLFGDEDILGKVTANLLTFGNISGDVFDRTQQMALDLSARLGQDLQSSTVMLGKALNDPTTGLTALTRVGVAFTEQQKEMIRGMVEAGNVAGAQAIMLDILEEQYAGQAAALANTDSGKIQQAMMAIGDAMERVGAVVLPILADMAGHVKAAAEWFQQLSPETQAFAVKAALAVAALGPLLIFMGSAVGALANLAKGFAAARAALVLLAGPIGIAVAAIAGLGFVIWRNWETIKRWAENVKDKIVDMAKAIPETIRGVINAVIIAIDDVWQAIKAQVVAWKARMEELAKDMMQGLINGMEAQKTRVGLTATNIMLELVGQAQKALGVQSPSRVFMQIGRWLMEGLGIGINQGTPGVVGQMQNSASQIAAAMGGGGPGLAGPFQRAEGALVSFGQVGEGVFERLGGWLVDLARGTTSVIDTIENGLRRLSQSMRQSGLNALTGHLTGFLGPAAGGIASGILGGLLGFASGGSFEVGGVGGVDSQIVAFRASPDERVTITKPGQMYGNGPPQRVEVEVSVNDDGTLRAVARQAGAQGALPIVAEAARTAREQQRRR